MLDITDVVENAKLLPGQARVSKLVKGDVVGYFALYVSEGSSVTESIPPCITLGRMAYYLAESRVNELVNNPISGLEENHFTELNEIFQGYRNKFSRSETTSGNQFLPVSLSWNP